MEAEAEVEAGVVVVVAAAVGVVVVVVVAVGDGDGAVAFSAAGGEVVGAGVAGSAHSIRTSPQFSPATSGAFCFSFSAQ